jgi:hypothetical protein
MPYFISSSKHIITNEIINREEVVNDNLSPKLLNNTGQQDFGTRMNPFALNLTCITMYKSEKMSFRERQKFLYRKSTEATEKVMHIYGQFRVNRSLT